MDREEAYMRPRGRPKKHPHTCSERPTTSRNCRTTKIIPMSTANANTAPTPTSAASTSPSSTLHSMTHERGDLGPLLLKGQGIYMSIYQQEVFEQLSYHLVSTQGLREQKA
ncbi:uncharacterized protein LOC130986971 [Salvia miltiorrhiza]|uniref:uncharacterized protein LOC130986971 n=1 Tax=Salvia miltiorrhiza TaxID=226208 RepID=UPI0025ACEBB7|nr:uncharacterized protein LOC130986971 [Salvia miltiorrhiza]